MINRILTDAKTAVATATTTITTGAATSLEWIPQDIGKLATLLGAILTATLIISHSVKIYLEHKESRERQKREQESHEIEMKIKKEKLKSLKEENQ